MSDLNTCAPTDPVCQSLTGEVPAPAAEYVAVSAQPFTASLQLVGAALTAAVLLVLIVAFVDWARK